MASGKCKDKEVRLPYQAKLNLAYQEEDFLQSFKTAFKEKRHLAHENKVILYNEPFQCCQMPNFINSKHFLEGLKEELLDQIFLEKNNDLYKFQQTLDFKTISTPHIKLIRKLLHEDFLSWLTDVTGFAFTDQIDLTGSRYDYTDVLLCHDDELDTRRIAFILYLVPPWSAEDGGMLDLFDMDEHRQPKDVVRSLLPSWNNFVWFEVTEASHHQVSEVLSPDKCRLSVHGWFHTAPVPRPERYVEPAPVLYPHIVNEQDLLSDWINPIYMDPEVQARIQMTFEKNSEIELQGFIKEDKYQLLREALCSNDMVWSMQGPPNKSYFVRRAEEYRVTAWKLSKRVTHLIESPISFGPSTHYDLAEENHLPEIVNECKQFLCSEQWFLTLSNLTGLTLHKLAADVRASSDSETDESPDAAQGGSTAGSSGDAVPDEDRGGIENDVPEKRRKQEKTSKEEDGGEGSTGSKEINPLCHAEVRRWNQGCYTLLHDTEVSEAEFALDAMLFICCKGWRQDYGGYTSYITRGEDEELLSVQPAENSLALVYRDKDTLRYAYAEIRTRVVVICDPTLYMCKVNPTPVSQSKSTINSLITDILELVTAEIDAILSKSANQMWKLNDHHSISRGGHQVVIEFNPITSDGGDKLTFITEMLKRLEPDIASVKEKVEDVQSEMRAVRKEQNHEISSISNDLRAVKDDVERLKVQNQYLQQSNKTLIDKVNQFECYSRRNNLIFNIEENYQPLEAIISELGVPDSDKMIFQTIHRMGKPSTTRPRPVIIRFAYLSERQTVWDLNGKKYSLNEDLPEDYKNTEGS
ncbi:hypothetical protein LSH36_359g03003 [Paralvinella palmiformis]|uniref:Prolyl 4-hydroxylase alpha subunit domain-containing protein n=1 Tax=Paralvinella palmiformis TaxID=53620 RepID=A0AAD9JEM0_9ANNE|nr:hypothetical protein LSH36_359g03003 [Paralvinella palmiformis]